MIESLGRLRLLRELARTGTVTGAAEAMHYTSSAASQQLAALEREAGSPLLERVGRGVRLTPAGRALALHAEDVLAASERAMAAVANAAGSLEGRLRIAVFADAAQSLLAPATALVARLQPALRLEVVERSPADARRAVRQRDVDVAVVHRYAFQREADDPGLDESPLYDEPLVLAVPPDDGAADTARPLAAFAGARWITGSPASICHDATVTACATGGFTPDIAHVTHDYAVQLALVHAGSGVALVPATVAAASTAQVATTRLTDPGLRRNVTFAVRRGALEQPSLAALRQALVTQIADAVDGAMDPRELTARTWLASTPPPGALAAQRRARALRCSERRQDRLPSPPSPLLDDSA